jgi:hypothetical protein
VLIIIVITLIISVAIALLRKKTRIYWVNSVIWLSLIFVNTFAVSNLQLNITSFEYFYLISLGLAFGVMGELVEALRV